MNIEIVCITTNGPRNDCQCITSVKSSAGAIHSVPEVIRKIQNSDTFFVRDPKDNSTVTVLPVPEFSPRYIRTRANDTSDDNLLQLPEC